MDAETRAGSIVEAANGLGRLPADLLRDLMLDLHGDDTERVLAAAQVIEALNDDAFAVASEAFSSNDLEHVGLLLYLDRWTDLDPVATARDQQVGGHP